MNTITIDFSKEGRKLLEDLMGSISLLTSVIGNALPQETQTAIINEATAPLQEAEVAVGIPVEGAAHLEPVTVEAEAPAPEVKPVVISLAEFQKAITLAVSKSAEAKKAVKTIINKYAPSVSAVPEDKRAEVMAELSKI